MQLIFTLWQLAQQQQRKQMVHLRVVLMRLQQVKILLH